MITPFTGQVACIEQALKTESISGITVGTINALQGAERQVVIFSSTYSKHSNGSFIDKRRSMLNVAVSRAKDSFLVFGDVDTIVRAPSGSPRGLLAKYLFSKEENELEFEALPRRDIIEPGIQPIFLRNADEHDQYMRHALLRAGTSVQIVSPWLMYERIKESGTEELLAQTTGRGVQVSIYTDRWFNSKAGGGALEEAGRNLAKLGVELIVLHGIHSKLFVLDDAEIVIGSFNWFSAARSGFRKHETSLVYCGPAVKNEIVSFRNDLEQLRSRRGQ